MDFDTGSVKASECVPRSRSEKCSNIKDRKTCLISEDDRPDYIGPCGWCGKACDDGNYDNPNWCEPVVWLKTTSISVYETCLRPGSDLRRIIHLIPYLITTV